MNVPTIALHVLEKNDVIFTTRVGNQVQKITI